MARDESTLVIWGAIAANLVIAISKFVVAGITRSSAMIAEAIHSSVDAGDGVLLLVGVRLSRRPPDEQHPFGHGRELYFWSMIVGIVIFGVGGGMSIYEGILHLIHPSPLESPGWSFLVLGVAALFEGTSWFIAFRHFQATRPAGRGVIAVIRESKDPRQFVVLLEDTAALTGIAIAAAGTALGTAFDAPFFDGTASILIGLVLCFVAVVLVYETRGLLIGEGVQPERAAAIRALVLRDDAVEAAALPLTMHLGPEDVLVNLALRFRRGIELDELEAAVRRIESRIREDHPAVRRIFLEAETLQRPVPRRENDPDRIAGDDPD
jgi:cation diffusion facilitator family transporter